MNNIVITRVFRNGQWNKTMEQARVEALRQVPNNAWSTVGKGRVIGEVTEEFDGITQTSQGVSFSVESIFSATHSRHIG